MRFWCSLHEKCWNQNNKIWHLFALNCFPLFFFFFFCAFLDIRNGTMEPSYTSVCPHTCSLSTDSNQIWRCRFLGPENPVIFITSQNTPSCLVTSSTGSFASSLQCSISTFTCPFFACQLTSFWINFAC